MTAKLSYTLTEAARAVGVSKSTIERRIRAGEIEAFKWCGRTLIRADVLERVLDLASGRAA